VLQRARSCMLAGMTESHGRADDHDHGHRDGDHHHNGDHGHDHAHGYGVVGRLRHLVRPHSHEAADKVDAAMEASAEGMRALWISLAVLGATAVLQAVVVAVSGSVALLGDTLHNAADALTAVPLGVAFLVAGAHRRAATPMDTGGPRIWPGS